MASEPGAVPVARSEACLGAEVIAAFIDGGLPAGERAGVVRHAADCALCAEALAATAQLVYEEDEEEGDDASPAPRPAARPVRPGRPLLAGLRAAAVLVAAAGGAGYLWLWRLPTVATAALVQPLAGADAARAARAWTAPVRGEVGAHAALVQPLTGADGAQASTGGRDFGLGVLLLDVRLGLDARDAETARAGWLALAGRLEPVEFMDDVAASCRQGAQRADDAAAGLARLEAVERRFAERFDADWLALGRWAEAARVAASLRRAAFFDNASNRRFLDVWRRRHGARLSSDENAALAGLGSAWRPGAMRAPDFAVAEQALTALVRARLAREGP